MQHESIDGVVVRVRDTGDHDRYLSILTAEKGRISMLAKGSRSLKGGQTAVSQLYTYGNFEYYKRGDFNILKGGSPIQSFKSLCVKPLKISRLVSIIFPFILNSAFITIFLYSLIFTVFTFITSPKIAL